MTTHEARTTGPGDAHALLGAGLLAATAFVRVPAELYRASVHDFASAPRDLLLAVFAAGLLLFVLLGLVVARLPGRLRRHAGPLLVALATYAWIRSGFFPGPSVNLDGSPLAADLSTGLAGLLVPATGGVLLAGLAARQPRAVTTLLAALLGASLVQSAAVAALAWRTAPRMRRQALASTLEWSRNGNVLILILDSLQSDVFEDVLLAEPRLGETLDGFRYYRLASSPGPTTYLSLPTIHGGVPYAPGVTVSQFYKEAIYEGSVLNRLANAGYRTSYAFGIGTCPKAVASCIPTAQLARSRAEVAFREALRLLDLGIYRVVPDRLREAVLRRGRGPLATLAGQGDATEKELDAAALARLAASTVTDSPPTAKMIHSMVTHGPLVLQPDCSAGGPRRDRVGARRQAQCAFKQVVALLDRLKAAGAYDVSSVVVVADHGYGIESRFATGSEDPKFRRMVGAVNPVVLVKPAAARGRLTTSDAPIQVADLPWALCGEEGCAPADILRRLDAVDAGRTRTAFWYMWKHAYWGLPHIPGLERYSIRGDLADAEGWSREAAAYAPGTVIEFRRGGNLGRYVGFGWGHRLSTHTWMVDENATLHLRGRFEPARDYALLIGAQPGPASPAAPKRVTVEVNGMEVGAVASTDPDPRFGSYRFTVPADVLARSPDTVIRFSANAAPDADGQASEAHLALKSLELRRLP